MRPKVFRDSTTYHVGVTLSSAENVNSLNGHVVVDEAGGVAKNIRKTRLSSDLRSPGVSIPSVFDRSYCYLKQCDLMMMMCNDLMCT